MIGVDADIGVDANIGVEADIGVDVDAGAGLIVRLCLQYETWADDHYYECRYDLAQDHATVVTTIQVTSSIITC